MVHVAIDVAKCKYYDDTENADLQYLKSLLPRMKSLKSMNPQWRRSPNHLVG